MKTRTLILITTVLFLTIFSIVVLVFTNDVGEEEITDAESNVGDFSDEPTFIGTSLLNNNEVILDTYTMHQIQSILDTCDYIQKLESGEIPWINSDESFNVIHGDLLFFNNGTHYIDNNVCKWIDSFESVTYNCFESNPMEQNWYFGPSYFENDTHRLDAQQCEWFENKNIKISTSSYMNEITPTLDDFRKFLTESPDIDTILYRFGKPHNDIGSGIHIYMYELNDNTQVWIGYTNEILYVRNVDSQGNILESLFEVEDEN